MFKLCVSYGRDAKCLDPVTEERRDLDFMHDKNNRYVEMSRIHI